MPSAVPAHDLSSRELAAPRGRRSLIVAKTMAQNARSRLRGGTSLSIQPLAGLDPGFREYAPDGDLSSGCLLELGPSGGPLPARSFNLIVSRAVLDKIHEIDRAFETLDRLLAPGGRMLHKIDLSDHGLFSRHGLHPLEFLTISEPVYRLMSACSGRPNRRRIDYYRRKMRQLGYFAGLLVTAIAGVDGELVPHKPAIEAGQDYFAHTQDLLRSIRPRLARPFRSLPDEDLAVTGIFLVAQKPS